VRLGTSASTLLGGLATPEKEARPTVYAEARETHQGITPVVKRLTNRSRERFSRGHGGKTMHDIPMAKILGSRIDYVRTTLLYSVASDESKPHEGLLVPATPPLNSHPSIELAKRRIHESKTTDRHLIAMRRRQEGIPSELRTRFVYVIWRHDRANQNLSPVDCHRDRTEPKA
jgi:hypothetical protein